VTQGQAARFLFLKTGARLACNRQKAIQRCGKSREIGAV